MLERFNNQSSNTMKEWEGVTSYTSVTNVANYG